MGKIAFVVVMLVPEADKEGNAQLEKEIREEFRIPWLYKIEKVTVVDMPNGKKDKYG